MRALSEEDRESVITYVNEKMDSLPLTFHQARESSPPPSKRARYNDCDDDFDDVIQDDKELSEVEAYQKQQISASEVTTVLKFWQTNEKKFPALSTLARQVFAVMSTSSASERNFSLAGVVVTARRSCLTSSSVNDLLFLNSARRAAKAKK